MYKNQVLARSRLLFALLLLIPTLLEAQIEKSAAFQTPLLEKQNLDEGYLAAYADYRLRAFEVGSITLRDAYVSPLRLEGVGFGFSSDQLRYTPQALKQYSTRIFSGVVIDQAEDFSLSALNFAAQYSWQFPFLEKPSGWKAYAGPWAQGYGNLRIALQNVNNVLGYDAGLELGATGRLEYKFKPGRREFILTQQLSVPLFGAFIRPLYTFTGPILGETDSEVSILQVGTLNRRFGWMYKASLDLYRKRKHKRKTVELIPYRISYTFQYDQYSQPNRFQSVVHSIGLARILKF
jgi:uncharacterized protein YjhX (UPF0386 family)